MIRKITAKYLFAARHQFNHMQKSFMLLKKIIQEFNETGLCLSLANNCKITYNIDRRRTRVRKQEIFSKKSSFVVLACNLVINVRSGATEFVVFITELFEAIEVC